MADTRLKDRIAVITGASSGLGKATALKFASVGARIVCADLNEGGDPTHSRINKTYGSNRATFVKCDVSSEEQIENLIKEAVKFGGRLDIICNYVGVAREPDTGMTRRIHDTDTKDFDITMSINTRGVWLCCKHAIRQMLEQEPLPPNNRGERTRGWIVNAASMLGLIGLGNGPCYVPSKHAVVGLTKSIGIDYAKDRIHCNCLAPGFINTPMIKNLIPGEEEKAGLAAAAPWNSLGMAEDVADAALFLASDEAAYVTGHALVVDGGYTLQ